MGNSNISFKIIQGSVLIYFTFHGKTQLPLASTDRPFQIPPLISKSIALLKVVGCGHHILTAISCTQWGVAPGPCFRHIRSSIHQTTDVSVAVSGHFLWSWGSGFWRCSPEVSMCDLMKKWKDTWHFPTDKALETKPGMISGKFSSLLEVYEHFSTTFVVVV